MARSIEGEPGSYQWTCSHPDRGFARGVAPTFAEATVDLAIAEATMLGEPYPRHVAAGMRRDPERYARYLPVAGVAS